MGGWLAALLTRRGARVHGYALPAAPGPSFFEAAGLSDKIASSTYGDIRDLPALTEAMGQASPSIVFHLAAQALVRRAHSEPLETFSTNVMGTANVLEAMRDVPGIAAAIVVTTDKVYRNLDRDEPYGETDELGGKEPYSASKAASEFVVDAWRHSYLDAAGVGVATIRAGNIFGGGDWAADRLVPDAIKGFEAGKPLCLRNPHSTRPWQHVLDPLPGYLTLAELLAGDRKAFAGGWNFGPSAGDCRPVGELAQFLAREWGEGAEVRVEGGDGIFEERLLALDSGKAATRLGWTPRWGLEQAVIEAIAWYRAHREGADMWDFTQRQISEHENAGNSPS
jgi:CDP-glucose 4,6-dehydratase